MNWTAWSHRRERFWADPRGHLAWMARTARLKFVEVLSTLSARALCATFGVPLGRGCRFVGVPYICRAPMSRISLGEGCVLRSDRTSNLVGVLRRCMIVTLREDASLSIGNRCGLSGAVIAAAQQITIEDDVLVGANTLVTDTDWHAVQPSVRRTGAAATAPVRIRRNVWLGVGVTVLKGVEIGENSVIAAGSVVSRDIPANVIAGGVPCKPMRALRAEE